MSGISQTSDQGIVELLRQSGPMSVSQLARATAVTPTAVRQRLARLMDRGLVDRQASPAGRGRPSHRYALTDQGHRQAGNNFNDLAVALWQEIRSISEPAVRRGLIARMAKRMAGMYADRVRGETVPERMQSLAAVFGERDVPLAIETVESEAAEPEAVEPEAVGQPALGQPAADAAAAGPEGAAAVLTVWACPYPELAEVDRGVCAMERMMFAELIEADVRLTACRLDGDACCRFQTAALPRVPLQTVPLAVSNPAASS